MYWFGPEKAKIQKGKHNNVYNTETMLPISEIRSDTVILKDAWLRAVIKVEWLNLDLKNYDEQEIVVEQYKRFLNGLDFPIQILLRNTYLELSDYITYMHNHVDKIEHDALKKQWDGYINFLNKINLQQGLVYVKEFYVVIPYYPLEADTNNIRKPRWKKFMDALSKQETPEKVVERYRTFARNSKFLDTRVHVVLEGLKSLGIIGERLGLADLISLLFKCYNPDLHKDQAVYTT